MPAIKRGARLRLSTFRMILGSSGSVRPRDWCSTTRRHLKLKQILLRYYHEVKENFPDAPL